MKIRWKILTIHQWPTQTLIMATLRLSGTPSGPSIIYYTVYTINAETKLHNFTLVGAESRRAESTDEVFWGVKQSDSARMKKNSNRFYIMLLIHYICCYSLPFLFQREKGTEQYWVMHNIYQSFQKNAFFFLVIVGGKIPCFLLLLKFGAVLSIICGFLVAVYIW